MAIKKIVIWIYISVWLALFLLISLLSCDWGNSGDDGWSMSWGYPMWLRMEGPGRFHHKAGGNQVDYLQYHFSEGKWNVHILSLLYAISVPLAPLTLFYWIYGLKEDRKRFRFHLSTLIAGVLMCGILMEESRRIFTEEKWRWSSNYWDRAWNFCTEIFPSITVGITICFIVWTARVGSRSYGQNSRPKADKMGKRVEGQEE